MGDERNPGHSAPDGRAPWERPLADRRYREEQARRGRHESEPEPIDTSERLSVAELMQKMGRPVPPAVGRSEHSDEPDYEPQYDYRYGYEPSGPPSTGPDAATEIIPAVTDDRYDDDYDDDEPGNPDWVEEATTASPQAVGSPNQTRLAASKDRKRRKLLMLGRSTVAFIAVMALVVTGGVWGYLRTTEGRFAQIAALDTDSADIIDPGGQTGDETYLIVGTDTRAGASGAVGAGTVEDAEGARSDTVMLVHVPADRSRVVAVSFPRDLDVERPECQGWDNQTGTYTDETYPAADGDKLNATYALGGPKCLVKVIQKISGVKIRHFVGMDFAGFESMVNGVGGVEVCVPQPLVDGELGTILPTAGTQTLDGKKALDYVRARHVEAEGNGDYGRIKRQQLFLSALLREAMSSKVLFDPGKLNSFINAFTQSTFVENIDTKSLITLGQSLRNVDAGAVTFITVPTAGTNDWGNEIPRLDDIKDIFRAIIDDEPLPGEKRTDDPKDTSTTPPPPAPSQLAVSPEEVSVQVSNGSGVSGLAATTADQFAAYGFQIYSVGNYSGTSSQTIVRFSPGLEAEAATVASSIPGAVLEQTSGLGTIVEVVLGSAFDRTLTAPAVAGSPLDVSSARIGEAEDVELPADLAVTNATDNPCAKP
ncbi:LytR family transcriptional regulator [Prescottella agglutinans]|uniref:LytR family transcriptional regulator n=1 Tax=Prescottella agglutinans TaxID=1644129 RepID=A0A3S3E844_9NOCA|nr:LCP family protein [Prescottella agglutinans]RVW07497.1 LytR family transcriptional regulator [Prescottella agglutinans]